MNSSQYKKISWISFVAIIINVFIYFGYILVDLFSSKLYDNENTILIVISLIVIVSIIGLICGIVPFARIRKLETQYQNNSQTKAYKTLTIVVIIINLGIVIYSLISLSVVIFFILA